jgi:hypothetical protein
VPINSSAKKYVYLAQKREYVYVDVPNQKYVRSCMF